MIKNTVYTLLVLLLLVAPVNAATSSNQNTNQPNNHPMVLDSSQNPWRAVGLLENPDNNKTCTAIIVGDYEILTSAYCLLDSDGKQTKNANQLIFKAGFKNGFYLAKTNIQSFLMPTLNYPPRNMDDLRGSWAFIFTTDPIGKIVGEIKINKNPITSTYLTNHKLITVGYKDNADSGLFASIKCSINKDGISYNDKNPNNPAPVFLQECKDYFKPLIGSPVLAIDNNNNVNLVGIITAKLTKNITSKRRETSQKIDLNVFIPMTYFSVVNKQTTNDPTNNSTNSNNSLQD